MALLALLAIRIRPLFWTFAVAFNVVGMVDLVVDYYHAVRAGLPALAGQLGATYAIPIIYVPALMITHICCFLPAAEFAAQGSNRRRCGWNLGRDRSSGQVCSAK